MSIITKVGEVYEIYMEQSAIDFGYISPLKYKHSPQGSGLDLCSCCSKKKKLYPASGDSPSSKIISVERGWMDKTGKICHIEVTGNIPFNFIRIP